MSIDKYQGRLILLKTSVLDLGLQFVQMCPLFLLPMKFGTLPQVSFDSSATATFSSLFQAVEAAGKGPQSKVSGSL